MKKKKMDSVGKREWKIQQRMRTMEELIENNRRKVKMLVTLGNPKRKQLVNLITAQQTKMKSSSCEQHLFNPPIF